MGIAIILDEPENPDNIGATIRAMGNMGLKDLRLVNPPEGWKADARKMAVGTASFIQKAKTFKTLKDAVKDVHYVLGTSRRVGQRRRAFLEFDQAMQEVKSHGMKTNAAVVFGKESKGLSNESLRVCDWFVTIPTSTTYPSINLAQAVMIVCFSLSAGKSEVENIVRKVFVAKEEFESIMEKFNSAIEALEYKPVILERIDRTFREMIKRGGLLKSEGQMIKGLSRRILERTHPILEHKRNKL